jgi:hypothetical protein
MLICTLDNPLVQARWMWARLVGYQTRTQGLGFIDGLLQAGIPAFTLDQATIHCPELHIQPLPLLLVNAKSLIMKDIAHFTLHSTATEPVHALCSPSGDMFTQVNTNVLSNLLTTDRMSRRYQDSVIGYIDFDPTPAGLGSVEFRIPQEEQPAAGTPVADEFESNHNAGITTTIMPAGAITFFHIDGIGAIQPAYHYFGQKIWIFAPRTTKNQAVLLDLVGQRCATLERALDYVRTVRPMKVLIVDRPTAFIIPATCLHAVLTLDSTSAHTTFAYWRWSDAEDTLDLVNALTNQLGLLTAENKPAMVERIEEALGSVEATIPEIVARRGPKRQKNNNAARVATVTNRIAILRQRLVDANVNM